MIFYRTKTRKYVKGYGFLSFANIYIYIYIYIYIKQLLERELDYLKNVPKKVVHRTSEFLENKIADAVSQTTIQPRNKNLLKKLLFN